MIRVIQRRLIIPRGDTGVFTIPAMTQAEGAIGVFTIFDPITNTRIFQKQVEIEGENFNISFSHADTVNLQAGNYLWDIKFYKNPILADNKVIDGEEINSYYAAFQAPKCEIRETGDDFLMIEGQPAKIEDLNIILAATEAANAAKVAATEKAEEAAAKLEEMMAAMPTKVSELENDSGYLQQETDPTVPAWAKAAEKPTYTAQEVGALPADTFIPSRVSDLTDDSGHYTKPANGIPASDLEETYLTQHQDISMKANSADLAAVATSGAYSDLNGTPTNVSAFTNDAGYLTEHQDISGKANSADLAAVATSGSYEDLSDKPTIPEVPVQDVQIDGNSIIENNIATIPYARTVNGIGNYGVVKVKAQTNGLTFVGDGYLAISPADSSTIKSHGNGNYPTYRPIVPRTQHQAVFYGLATAAGDTTQSESDNEVGTYTADAKAAIQTMLDVPSNAEMNTAIGTAIGNINSFDMAVVQELPTQDISTHTIYLVPKTGETNDVYDEYVYINNAWEMVGNTQVDLSNYVQKTDYATANEAGVIKVSTDYGLQMTNDGFLRTRSASQAMVKAGENNVNQIAPMFQHMSTFYGLAKAAGDTTQSISSNAVGTYTTEAKAAIQTMLDVPAKADIPDVSIYATKADTVLETTLSLGRLANSDVGENSIALGYDVTASGDYSFATGSETIASSDSAHAEGENTQATDSAAHAEGTYTQATGYASHAEGDSSVANGWFSHAEGSETAASGRSTHVFGERNFNTNKYPSEDNEQRGTMVEIVGNGQGNGYSNARALTWTGDEYLAGNLYVNANATSTSGTRVATVTEIPEVPVQDVQVNGTSVVGNDGVANVPVAKNNTIGLVMPYPSLGTGVANNGGLAVVKAEANNIKVAADEYRPIVPINQHMATFYGLAKAAGDATQSASSNAVGVYTDSAKTAIKNMLGITQTLTVTVLTQDNVTVTGQTVTIRAVDATGPIFATAAYEGQPVAFAMPSGFAYHISVSDTLDHHFNPTTASGVITNTDVSVTLQYSDFSTIHTAADIKAALNAGMDLTDLVGEQITCTRNGETLTWDVADYDATNGRIMLLLHDAFGSANMVFEPAQALMWCENGLAASSYTFADGNTHYYFTTSTALPAGGQLRATDTTYYLYASQASTGTLETGTVSTTEIAGATDLGTCAQGLLNHFSRNRYGSNNIAESAIQWWLNSTEAANVQRPFITKFQRPQSYNVPGFMNGLDQEFIDCLDEVDWKCSTNNAYECPKSLGGLTDGTGRAYTLKAKFCLASEMEIFGSYGGNQDGSTIFDLYNGADADDRKKYRGTSAQVWWLRSPYWNGAGNGRTVSSSGGAGNGSAITSCAVVPACRISRDTEVNE